MTQHYPRILMDDTFTPRFGNDAYGAIRGFVYQVDLTIERWLELREEEWLELERGEDIDHLSRALLDDGTRQNEDVPELLRILEQVKHLQRPITLRSASVRAALCNASEHVRANPGQRLLFRFTTTAAAAREASSTLPGQISGIQAWEELRQGGAAACAPTYQQGIRLLLRARKPPKGVGAVVWRRFQEFVRDAGDEAFTAFVRRFEWSVGAPGAEARPGRLLNKLVEKGLASSPEEAQNLYDRLFVHVFRLLSQRGTKSLSLTELDRTLARPTLTAGDRQLLRTLAAALADVDERVGSVERTLASYSAALPEISDRLDNLARQQGIEAAVDYTIATPDLDPPPPLVVGAARKTTVDRLWNVVQDHPWTALIGASTTGKTQLALNVVRTHAPKARWLRLRDLSVAQASMRLDKAVESLEGPRAARSLRDWYTAMAVRASTFQLVVLDDVPRFETGDEFAARLDALLQGCEHAGLRLLTTSAYTIPPSCREQYADERVAMIDVPPFTDEEAGELLLARGAPPAALSPSYIQFLRAITKNGNPALLQAMVRYLSQAGWSPSSALNGLATKEYSAEVNAETVRRVLETVESVEARSLLYRLNLIGGDFSMTQAAIVAEVEPPVVHPRERLEQLLGLWVQSESANRFSISPLIQTLGSEDLPKTTLLNCHLVLAHEIVGRPSINQVEAVQALSHFVSGGDHNGAAFVLLRGLDALARVEGDPQDPILGAIWIDLPLPVEIDLALRLQIRAFQVRLRAKQGKDISFLLDDFDALLEKAGKREAWSVFSAAFVVSSATVPHNVRGAGKYLKLLRKTWPQLPGHIQTKMSGLAELKPSTFVWLGSASVSSEDDLLTWLANIEALDPAARNEALESTEGGRAAMHVANGFYLAETEKPIPERDWNRALSLLDVMERRGRELNLEPIWGAAIANRVSIVGGMLGDVERAHEIADAVLSAPGLAPRTKFRVRVALGLGCLDLRRPSEARVWMQAARLDVGSAPPSEAVDLLLRLSKVIGEAEGSACEALEIAEEAGRIATRSMSGFLDAKVAGEIAVARWLDGDLRGAFRAWEHLAERVLETFPGDAEWKKLYVPFAHGAGFFFAVAGRADPSELLASRDGYAPPYRGMFLDTSWDLDGARIIPEVYVYVHTAIFAEGVGEHGRASLWAMRGLAVVGPGDHAATGMLIPITEVDAIEDGRFVDAFVSSRHAGQIFVSAGMLRSAGTDTLAAYDIEAVLGAREGVAWDEIEAFALNTGVVPALLQIGRRAVVEPDRFHENLRTAADACMHVAVESTRPEMWKEAAKVFTMLVSGASLADLLAMGSTGERPPHAGAAIYQLGYLAASLHPGVSLTTALEVHLYTARHIQVYLYAHPAFQRIAIPFFFEYWTARLAAARFNFDTPALVERRMADAAREPVRQRLPALFEAVADGLRFRIPPNVLVGLRGAAG